MKFFHIKFYIVILCKYFLIIACGDVSHFPLDVGSSKKDNKEVKPEELVVSEVNEDSVTAETQSQDAEMATIEVQESEDSMDDDKEQVGEDAESELDEKPAKEDVELEEDKLEEEKIESMVLKNGKVINKGKGNKKLTQLDRANGENLYSTYCSSCHGATGESDILGYSAEQIQEVLLMQADSGPMKGLIDELSIEEIALIAESLEGAEEQ